MTRSDTVRAVLALVVNAFIWGVSWWPMRQLQGLGLHPLWSTALVYALAAGAIALRWPDAPGRLLRTPRLWWLVLAAGCTNAAFNWAVSIGDVVRVVLLFYLMPLWAVLLARLLLGERLNRWSAVRVALALAGAAVVLAPAGGAGWPLPQGLADWLGVAGGFSFALNNVLLRRAAGEPAQARAMAMFVGGLCVAGGLAVVLLPGGSVAPLPALTPPMLAGIALLAAAFAGANLALQHGASQLPASVTAVVMLLEVLFASVSAVWLGDQHVTARLLLGGLLIVAAATLSVVGPPGRTARAPAPD